MLVSNTNRSIAEERNKRINQEPVENDTPIVSSFVHGGFTTSDYDGRLISRSFLHFKSYGNAMAMLWQCYGNATAMLWQCYGNAMAMLWQCYGNAMAMLWQRYGNPQDPKHFLRLCSAHY
jgi:hypothetical protein